MWLFIVYWFCNFFLTLKILKIKDKWQETTFVILEIKKGCETEQTSFHGRKLGFPYCKHYCGGPTDPSVSSPCVLQVSEKQSWTTMDFITITCGCSVCLFFKADCLRSLIVVVRSLSVSDFLAACGLYSTPGFAVLHYLPEFAQIHVHWVSEAF